jgi:hypothetical protein
MLLPCASSCSIFFCQMNLRGGGGGGGGEG